MKTTQKLVAMLIVIGAVLLMNSVSVQAQKGYRADKAKAKIEKLKTEFNLTEAQVSSIKTIIKDARPDRKEAKQKKDREEMREIAKETQDKIMNVLNSDQQVKFKEMISNRKNDKNLR